MAFKYDKEVRALLKASGLTEAQINQREVETNLHMKRQAEGLLEPVEINEHLQEKFDSGPLERMGS